MFYKVDFACDDQDELQARLNRICDYAEDVETKVLHRERMNLFFLLMQDLIRGGVATDFGSALDIGCNTGIYSKMISDFGYQRVRGIDIVPDMIERASRTFGMDEGGRSIAFDVADAERLDRELKYDFILCTEVIEHTAHPELVIANIKQMLSPRGVAVVTLPNAWSFPYQVARLAYAIKRPPRNLEFEDHLKFPFPRSLRLLRGDGLRLVRTDGANLLLETHLLRLLYGTPAFAPFNRLQFGLGRMWPFRYFAQFFFMVLVRDDRPNGAKPAG